MTVVANGAIDAVFAILDSRSDPHYKKKLQTEKLRAESSAPPMGFEGVADALEARAKKVSLLLLLSYSQA